MYPFEVWNESTGRIEFYWNRWADFKEQLFQQYPCHWSHQRVQMKLLFPSDRLEDVPVHNWNPHHQIGNYHLSNYDCFYDRDDWSTIFEVYPAHVHHTESWIFFVEQGHQDPWGEPIRIMSTSADISDHASHRYAYFRGKYWKVGMWAPIFPTWNLGMWMDWLAVVATLPRIDWLGTNEEERLWLIPPIPAEKPDWLNEGF